MASSSSSSSSSKNNPDLVTLDEFFSFHHIDRRLFVRLVFVLRHEPAEAMQAAAFWLWLERVSCRAQFVQRILMFPDEIIDVIFQETMRCLRAAERDEFMAVQDEARNDIPLIRSVVGSDRVRLRFFYENRISVLSGVGNIVQQVCLRAFQDLLRLLVARTPPGGSFQESYFYDQSLFQPRPLGGGGGGHDGSVVVGGGGHGGGVVRTNSGGIGFAGLNSGGIIGGGGVIGGGGTSFNNAGGSGGSGFVNFNDGGGGGGGGGGVAGHNGGGGASFNVGGGAGFRFNVGGGGGVGFNVGSGTGGGVAFNAGGGGGGGSGFVNFNDGGATGGGGGGNGGVGFNAGGSGGFTNLNAGSDGGGGVGSFNFGGGFASFNPNSDGGLGFNVGGSGGSRIGGGLGSINNPQPPPPLPPPQMPYYDPTYGQGHLYHQPTSLKVGDFSLPLNNFGRPRMDLSQGASSSNVRNDGASSSNNPPLPYPRPHFPNYDPSLERDLAEILGQIYLSERQSLEVDVPPSERTIFLTFSKGYPISESELTEFLTRTFGDIIEALYMHEVTATNEQPLYARLVVRDLSTMMAILGRQSKAKFAINGKHMWARKYISKNNNNNNTNNSPPSSPPHP